MHFAAVLRLLQVAAASAGVAASSAVGLRGGAAADAPEPQQPRRRASDTAVSASAKAYATPKDPNLPAHVKVYDVCTRGATSEGRLCHIDTIQAGATEATHTDGLDTDSWCLDSPALRFYLTNIGSYAFDLPYRSLMQDSSITGDGWFQIGIVGNMAMDLGYLCPVHRAKIEAVLVHATAEADAEIKARQKQSCTHTDIDKCAREQEWLSNAEDWLEANGMEEWEEEGDDGEASVVPKYANKIAKVHVYDDCKKKRCRTHTIEADATGPQDLDTKDWGSCLASPVLKFRFENIGEYAIDLPGYPRSLCGDGGCDESAQIGFPFLCPVHFALLEADTKLKQYTTASLEAATKLTQYDDAKNALLLFTKTAEEEIQAIQNRGCNIYNDCARELENAGGLSKANGMWKKKEVGPKLRQYATSSLVAATALTQYEDARNDLVLATKTAEDEIQNQGCNSVDCVQEIKKWLYYAEDWLAENGMRAEEVENEVQPTQGVGERV